MPMHPSQLERLSLNCLYHYDAAYFYQSVASGEIPEFPPEIDEGEEGIGVLAARNGFTREGPPMVAGRELTPDEIEELNGLSDVHLSAAIQLDEVIQEVVPAEEAEEVMREMEARMPKRSGASVLRRRAAVPRGRPSGL